MLEVERRLLESIDEALARATAEAAGRLVCPPGCAECCLGPFPINLLDAGRLRRGLAALRLAEPARATAVGERASQAREILEEEFPGEAVTGVLCPDGALRERFLRAHRSLPCPALDPARRRCDLYDSRPLSCRTFGPPVRIGAEDLPPCRRCFTGSAEAEDRCRMTVDPDGLELALLETVSVPADRDAETLVAFALWPPSSEG